MKLKKFASFLGFVLTLCFAAGCAQSAPPEPGFDAADLPFYVEDTDSLNYSYLKIIFISMVISYTVSGSCTSFSRKNFRSDFPTKLLRPAC